MDPQNTPAPAALKKVLGSLKNLSPENKSLIPEVVALVDGEIPTLTQMAKLTKQATGRLPGGGTDGIMGMLSRVPVLNLLAQSTRTNALSQIGAVQGLAGLTSQQVPGRIVGAGVRSAISQGSSGE